MKTNPILDQQAVLAAEEVRSDSGMRGMLIQQEDEGICLRARPSVYAGLSDQLVTSRVPALDAWETATSWCGLPYHDAMYRSSAEGSRTRQRQESTVLGEAQHCISTRVVLQL